ncbi:MAG: dihydroorotate dehydrogenase-like protein [Bacteroidales bacterium]|nr:dihydroorotate dehydrogenase-like protein [Bacteroidales bacterium]
MADLSTKYLGIQLKNPIIIGSSDLTSTIEGIIDLEKNGAGAIVLKSIFEEEILLETDEKLKKARENKLIYSDISETIDYLDLHLKQKRLSDYIRLIKEAKSKVLIPVIASINCITDMEWVDYAKKIQEAGADALELNIHNPTNDNPEKTALRIINKVLSSVGIPVSVKISSAHSNLNKLILNISQAGVSGIVLFNRYYMPDIDIMALKVTNDNILSFPDEYYKSLQWIGLIYDKVKCDLVASTGIHSGDSAIKQILVGASAVQVVSAIKKYGLSYISQILNDIEEWMETQKFNTVQQFKGKLSYQNTSNPAAYNRVQFMKYYGNIGR